MDVCPSCGGPMGAFRGWDPELGADVCFKCYIDAQKRSEEKERKSRGWKE